MIIIITTLFLRQPLEPSPFNRPPGFTRMPWPGGREGGWYINRYTYIILYHLISSYIILYHLISSYIILYHLISSYILSSYILSSYIVVYYTVYTLYTHIISTDHELCSLPAWESTQYQKIRLIGRQKDWQKTCQKECQKVRQKECQRYARQEQNVCQIECLKACDKLEGFFGTVSRNSLVLQHSKKSTEKGMERGYKVDI